MSIFIGRVAIAALCAVALVSGACGVPDAGNATDVAAEGAALSAESQDGAALEANAADADVETPWVPTLLPDGQPDVSGIWQARGPGAAGLNVEALPNMMESGRTASTTVIDPPDGRIPYLPWARVRRDEVQDHHLAPNQAQVDTRNRGWPDGVPRINYYTVNPFQIIQPEGKVVVLYEAQHEFRVIPLDDRPQPDVGVTLWMGSSRGHWEGHTLVVDVRNVSDRVRLSVAGDFHSDAVQITERWNFLSADTLRHETTFVDPSVYSAPWTMYNNIQRNTGEGFELMEYAGVEGEKDADLMVDIPAAVRKAAGSE